MKKYLLIILFAVLFPISASACGGNLEIQWDNGGTCGADPNFTWHPADKMLYIQGGDIYPAVLVETPGTGFQVDGNQTTPAAMRISGTATPDNILSFGLWADKLVSFQKAGSSYYMGYFNPVIKGEVSGKDIYGTVAEVVTVPSGPYVFTGSLEKAVGYGTRLRWGSGYLYESDGIRIFSPIITGGTVGQIRGLVIEDQVGGTSTPEAIHTGLGMNVLGDKTVIGATTTNADFQAADKNGNATTSIVLGKVGQNKGTCLTRYDTAGNPVYEYYAAGALKLTATHTKPAGCED